MGLKKGITTATRDGLQDGWSKGFDTGLEDSTSEAALGAEEEKET